MRCPLLVVAGHVLRHGACPSWPISQVSKAKRLTHQGYMHEDMRCPFLVMAGHRWRVVSALASQVSKARWSVVHVLASQVSKAKSLLTKARA
ncbi:hypothetical protein TIFTF001_016440 [Ficus carica]|uniref:Uncharacterized protein n=1 Tax=Ficus carica TaxID=3494 RepID=A0AA88AAI8_FICCA|nr:hypothetical protein TIFTF001_016440 [Ficus carica]